ncbi:MAG: radical SAM protein [Deltaproteobacteria bacterium]|nr:radical SAM protein [Deltaproteobacteria bacterium]
MWFKTRNGIIRNSVRPLVQNLDRIPLPDYSCINHFISSRDGIEDLTTDKLIKFEGERFSAQKTGISYSLLTSRGCPFSCTYCCNSVYENLYPKQRRLRWRSIDNVISELQMIQNEVASLSFVHIVDDNFTSQSTSDLEIFCERYRTEIAIPFSCQVSPLTVSEDKIETLLNAGGCAKVTMGVETSNERISKLYLGRS